MANVKSPTELSTAIKQQWQCRDAVIEQLAALLVPSLPSPPTITVHGPHATGKTSIVKAIAEQYDTRHVYSKCDEYITERHLFERTVATVSAKVQPTLNDTSKPAKAVRCETVNALITHLEQLLPTSEKFVLIFDGIDRQREASSMLLSALSRLAEGIPHLVVILIVSDPSPRYLRRPGVPHIHFEQYTREQSIHIVSQSPLDIFLGDVYDRGYSAAAHEEDKAWLWPRFCAAVWDSLGSSAARDLESFRDLCHKLWRPFVEPIVKGELGTRNISRLMVAQRRLFQDETVLLSRLVTQTEAEDNETSAQLRQHDLPYFAKWLLLAAFLASTNPSRLDALYFMKTTEKKRRKKGGGTAKSAQKAAQQRRIPRHLLAPSPFPLDRLLSIFHAILPDGLRTNIDIYTQIATLTSLRLLSKGSGLAHGDVLEPGTKWRIGPVVTWEFITRLAASVDFLLLDYIAE